MDRPSIADVMLGVALAISTRACCQRWRVGCVLVDRHGRILGTGYNGRPRGMPNCEGKTLCAEDCEGVHAEINALLMANPDAIDVAYVTHAPCWHCVKALINTGCSHIIFVYNQTEEPRAKQLWQDAGREWFHRQDIEP